MNKLDAIKQLSKNENISMIDARKQLNAVLNVIEQGLQHESVVTFRNFGKWQAVERKAKVVYNPKTKKRTLAKAHKIVYFRNSQKLKSKINK